MRKAVALIAVLPFILSLAGCGGTVSPGVSSPSEESPSAPPSPPPIETVVIPPMNPPMPLPEYLVIDGSSSTATMHGAIRAYLTDEYFYCHHSQTYAALERLIPGHEDPADLLLSVKYYDETLQDANDRGAELVITPVAKEGFVFLVHKDNPVDSLTQQQIRDIYAGKITNWKEVGGKNAKITPYIRNWDSGSQTAMEDFMGRVPVEATEETPLFSMSVVLESVYTNPDAIGYNMYSWTMEQEDRGIKTVAVDGIRLSNETLSNGSYPLIIYTYSYYNEGNAKGKALADWLLTAEGQDVVASAGYVGLFGALPPNEWIDFSKDEQMAAELIETYYRNIGIDSFAPLHLDDKKQALALANGKEKSVTCLFSMSIFTFDEETDIWETTNRFIVLTRDKGGAFEVINEGEWP